MSPVPSIWTGFSKSDCFVAFLQPSSTFLRAFLGFVKNCNRVVIFVVSVWSLSFPFRSGGFGLGGLGLKSWCLVPLLLWPVLGLPILPGNP